MSQGSTLISQSGKRRHPRVSLNIRGWINERTCEVLDISANGMACRLLDSDRVGEKRHPSCERGDTVNVALAFNVDGLDVVFRDEAKIVQADGNTLRLRFLGKNDKGEKILEYLIDAYLTGDLERSKQLIAGILGMNQESERQRQEKRSALLSILIFAGLLFVSIALIYSNLSRVEVVHAIVSQKLHAITSPSDGIVYPLVKEKEQVRKGDLLFIIKGKNQSVALASIYSKLSTLKKKIRLKKQEKSEAERLLQEHVAKLKESRQTIRQEIRFYRHELKNQRKIYQAYLQAARSGAVSRQDAIEAQNQLLKLKRILLRKENALRKLNADLDNARQGLYSVNGIIRENFSSPHQIERDIKLMEAEILSLSRSLKKIAYLDGVKIQANRDGRIRKLLVEYGNGVVNGQTLAYLAAPRLKKRLIAVIRSQDNFKVQPGQRVTVRFGTRQAEGEVERVLHSYQDIALTDRGETFYGIQDFTSYEYSFVFIRLPEDTLKNQPIGAQMDVTIHTGLWGLLS